VGLRFQLHGPAAGCRGSSRLDQLTLEVATKPLESAAIAWKVQQPSRLRSRNNLVSYWLLHFTVMMPVLAKDNPASCRVTVARSVLRAAPAQVDALFITHLHGDHCFGIGTMLVALNKARNKAAAAAGSTSHSSSGAGGKLPGPDSRSALRVFGPPRVGELVSSMLFIAGVGRQLDQPVYITEFVETAR
jgi:hypothetical protein